jgi:hypothetical protein
MIHPLIRLIDVPASFCGWQSNIVKTRGASRRDGQAAEAAVPTRPPGGTAACIAPERRFSPLLRIVQRTFSAMSDADEALLQVTPSLSWPETRVLRNPAARTAPSS